MLLIGKARQEIPTENVGSSCEHTQGLLAYLQARVTIIMPSHMDGMF